jgi:hypothetical protein
VADLLLGGGGRVIGPALGLLDRCVAFGSRGVDPGQGVGAGLGDGLVTLARGGGDLRRSPRDGDGAPMTRALLMLLYRSGLRVSEVLALRPAANRQGHRVNRKKVQRLWREEGLRVPPKRRKRPRLGTSATPASAFRAERPDHVWALPVRRHQRRPHPEDLARRR